MLQYKIPQNVGIEDKIVGPFSLRQLIILAVGGGISYVLFAITSRIYELNILEYILIAFPALFALAAAMLKIHNVSFTKYILLMLEFAIKPKKRMWDHRGISALVAPDLTDKAASKRSEVTEEKGEKNVNLRDLSAMLDSGGFEHIQQVKHEDIDEVKDDDLITEAYFGHKKEESSTQNMYWRTRDMQKKKLDLLATVKASAKAASTTQVPAPAPPAPPAVEPPTPAPTQTEAKPEKKESVAEHLASVIKEARENNRTKKEVEPSAITPTPTETPKKKRRRRRRKPKAQAQPVREGTQVNTTSKAPPPKPSNKSDNKEGETSYSDLSGGDEIEINLD